MQFKSKPFKSYPIIFSSNINNLNVRSKINITRVNKLSLPCLKYLAVKTAVVNFNHLLLELSKMNRSIIAQFAKKLVVRRRIKAAASCFKGIINRGSFSQHKCPNHACVFLCRITLRINKLVVVQLGFYTPSGYQFFGRG